MPIAIRDAEMHEHARATTVGPDGRLIVQKKEYDERPVRPPVPLVQGVWRMLFTEEVLAKGILITLLFGGAAWFIHGALTTPLGLASIAALFVMIMGAALGLAWLSFAAPLFLAIVAESSEGHDKLHDPPQWSPLDWFVEAAYFMSAAAVAAAPALAVWRLGVPLPLEGAIALGATAGLVIFPLALLGALLESSPFGVISPRLLSTLFRCPGPWLMFYAITAVIAAAVAAAAWGALSVSEAGFFAVPVLVSGATILYMRLLGRLGWWIGDALPEEDEPEANEKAA
jgi:hypothetical protein